MAHLLFDSPSRNEVIDIQTFMLALGVGNIAFALLMAGYMRGADNSPASATGCGAACRSAWPSCAGGSRRSTEMRCWSKRCPACVWLGGVALEVGANCLFFGFTRWRKSLYLFTLPGWVAVAMRWRPARRAAADGLISFIIALSVFGAAVVLLRPREAPLLQRIIGVNNILFALAIWAWLGFEGGSPAASARRR
jgi:hypothetical protein